MDLLGIKDLATRSLRGTAEWVAPSIHISLNGSGDATAAGELRIFVEQIETRARALRAHSVVFDVREVTLLSSSCLASFVRLVVGAAELPLQDRMRVAFRIAPERWWQERSFAAIRALDPELVQIVEVRAA